MLKELAKSVARLPLFVGLQQYMAGRVERRFATMRPAEVFGEIYRRKMWGSTPQSDFCSGQGSHYQSIVDPYLVSVRRFLSDFAHAPNAVDLGCGDFRVGSHLRSCCNDFIATDVVAALIERNRRLYEQLDVSFRCVDIVSDDLPAGDVAFLRQVAQHLSNAQIAKIIPKLYKYRWVIVSEHLPIGADFVANVDKPTGSGVRVPSGSGVVLTAPPFNLKALESRVLCSVTLSEMSGVVQSIAYRLIP
jgi:hypothetical protein